jgi:hypothetical protein
MPAGGQRPMAEGFYRLLVRLYPTSFRAAYGEEMLGTFREWHRQRHAAGTGALRFWGAVTADVARSLPREWAGAMGSRQGADRPPYGAAALAGLAVLVHYTRTLAPSTGFWDAGEYITAAHVLGIPHPPGSPLFVLLAHAWEALLAPTGLSPAVRINLFSAVLSASAHALWFLVVDRALGTGAQNRVFRRVGAAAAVALSATAFTVWSQSDVNEKVYAVSFFTTALASWLALRWRDGGRDPNRLLPIVLLVTVTATNHLMGVLVVPALLVFFARVGGRALLRLRSWAFAIPLVALGLLVHLFLPLRAARQPVLSEGAPACESTVAAVESALTWGAAGCEALSSVLRRDQYGKPPVTLDPTVYPDREVARGVGLLGSQLLNYLQYFDWQWGRSVAGGDPLFGGARPLLSLAFLLLGLHGARAHWRRDRESALYLGTLFLTLSIGLVL